MVSAISNNIDQTNVNILELNLNMRLILLEYELKKYIFHRDNGGLSRNEVEELVKNEVKAFVSYRNADLDERKFNFNNHSIKEIVDTLVNSLFEKLKNYERKLTAINSLSDDELQNMQPDYDFESPDYMEIEDVDLEPIEL